MGILITVAIIILILAAFIWLTYNQLVTLKERITEALSSIDIQLKRRSDLIPNLVETVKGYAKHEKQLLENVTNARSELMGAKTPEQKARANNMVTDTLKSLFAVAEGYPDLKASANFLKLQEELSDTEDKISYSRQFYNSNVLSYNTKIKMFPSNFIAGQFNFKEQEFFEAEPAAKDPIKVSF